MGKEGRDGEMEIRREGEGTLARGLMYLSCVTILFNSHHSGPFTVLFIPPPNELNMVGHH